MLCCASYGDLSADMSVEDIQTDRFMYFNIIHLRELIFADIRKTFSGPLNVLVMVNLFCRALKSRFPYINQDTFD